MGGSDTDEFDADDVSSCRLVHSRVVHSRDFSPPAKPSEGPQIPTEAVPLNSAGKRPSYKLPFWSRVPEFQKTSTANSSRLRSSCNGKLTWCYWCSAWCRAGHREVWRSRRSRQISTELCSVNTVPVCSTSSPAVPNGRLSSHVSRRTSPPPFNGSYFPFVA